MITIWAFSLASVLSSQQDVSEIKSDLLQILAYYEPLEVTEFKEEIVDVLQLIKEFEESENEDTFQLINERYELIAFAHKFSLELASAEEAVKTRYFRVWDQVTYLKKRVDNLYTFKESVGNSALGFDSEEVNVYKKPIYIAYNVIFDEYMNKLKGTYECEYQQKIEYLSQIIPVLAKCENLLTQENTKELEKSLKKLENVEEIEKMLIGF